LAIFYRTGPNFTEVGYGRYLLTGWSDWVPPTLKMTSAANAIPLRVTFGHPIAYTAPGGDLAIFYRTGPHFTKVGNGRYLRTGWSDWVPQTLTLIRLICPYVFVAFPSTDSIPDADFLKLQ
jgi:hypothetical protein